MNNIERIWEECWTRVAHGEATIEDCLERYPEYADELRRLFAAAIGLNQGRLVRPKAEYKARARAELLANIRSRSSERFAANYHEPSHLRVIPLGIRAGAALIVLVFLLVVSGTMLAQAALPGDALYGWKIGSEDVFRSIYPDAVTADLALTNRRADELTRVVGTPAAERAVQREYQKLLTDLPRHNSPSTAGKIREQLTAQKAQLQRAGVNLPAIDQTLGNLSAAPVITATATATATQVRKTPTVAASRTLTSTPRVTPSMSDTPSPSPSAVPRRTRRLTPTPSPTTTPSATATQTPTQTASPTRTLSATATQTPTLEPEETPRRTRRAKATETPSATLCATRPPEALLSSEPCATPTANPCKEEATTPSCETPARTSSPTGLPLSGTRSATPTPPPSATPSVGEHTEVPDSLASPIGE